jgi:hypothetical protein
MVDWSEIEVELIIANYFSMLSNELEGTSYSKALHRRNLIPLLNNRSEGSIEFKHQNISAVLINLGQPYIKGYLPRFNYQKILEEKVIEYLQKNLSIENRFKEFADNDVIPKKHVDFNKLIVDPPENKYLSEPIVYYQRNPIKTNYIEREQENNKLGISGEEIVFQYEKWQLVKKGKENLAEKVLWVSKDEGDGAGFDILSKNNNGTDKYIEVKTTKLGKETPFFFTRNELLFSQSHSANYNLYRIFNYGDELKMFIKNGSIDTICYSVPITYKGHF